MGIKVGAAWQELGQLKKWECFEVCHSRHKEEKHLASPFLLPSNHRTLTPADQTQRKWRGSLGNVVRRRPDPMRDRRRSGLGASRQVGAKGKQVALHQPDDGHDLWEGSQENGEGTEWSSTLLATIYFVTKLKKVWSQYGKMSAFVKMIRWVARCSFYYSVPFYIIGIFQKKKWL